MVGMEQRMSFQIYDFMFFIRLMLYGRQQNSFLMYDILAMV